MYTTNASWKEIISQGFALPNIDRSTTLVEAVTMATNAIEQHLLSSPLVRKHLAAIPKGKDTDCLDAPLDELVKYVANQKGTVDKSDPSLTLRFLMTYVQPVFELEQQAVLGAVKFLDDVSQEDWLLMSTCRELASAVDRFWAEWFKTIVVPYQSLDETGKKQYMEHAKAVLAQYDYTVSEYDPQTGLARKRTWAEALPTEIADICQILRALEGSTMPELRTYFAALRRAYACTEITNLEDRWAEVDRRWVRIPRTARLMPVHGMESMYEHPFGVSPEFRLDVRTADGADVIESRRAATLDHAAVFGLGNELMHDAVLKLERVDISVFGGVFRAGVSSNFRYSGQAVPNRQKVAAEGCRIFLDRSAPLRAMERYRENIRKYCAPATATLLAPLITEESRREHVATHEYAHFIGRTVETDNSLGAEGMSICEEAKATLLGILADEYHDPSPEHRLSIVANTVGQVLRFMYTTELMSDTFAPYVRENLAAATMLFESGVMTLGVEGVEVNAEAARSSVWFDALRVFNHIVLNAYQATDKAALEGAVARYCDKTHPQIAELIAWVNR